MIKTIKSKAFEISNWSGGTTSELFIYPAKSKYKTLDFLFRLSKATIEQDYSVFTPLKGVNRKLMLLEGDITLKHKTHHTASLKPLEFDTFLGDWTTECIGKATDFNLMMRGKTSGEYKVVTAQNAKQVLEMIKDDFTFLYIVKGNVLCEEIELKTGDLMVIEREETMSKIELGLSESTTLLIVKVNL